MPQQFRASLAITVDLYPVAECQYIDCDWKTTGDDALANVKWHCGETGHEVHIERTSRSIYRGTVRPTGTRKKATR